MIILITALLLLSLTANIILVWYCKKLLKNLWNGVQNIDELNRLLLEYSSTLESLYVLEEYYDNDEIKVAISNTKLIVEACRVYKDSIIEKQGDDIEKTTT